MLATLTLLAAAQAITSTPGADPPAIEQRNVAYEAVAAGRSAEAIETLEAQLREDPRDPATLINLGAAYAKLGDTERAKRAYRAAMTSRTRYRLELADGTWDDSRAVARRALEGLQQSAALAALDD